MASGLAMTDKEKSPEPARRPSESSRQSFARSARILVDSFGILALPPVRRARIVKGMCGIAGIYARPGSEAPQELLLTMAGELRHRGPDGTGLYVDGRYGMTNNRLAIVDLAGGDQPLSNEDGR